MSARSVRVVVEVTSQHIGVVEIDDDDYRAWLGEGENGASSLYEYLQSGSDTDEILANASLGPGEILLRQLSDVADD